MNAFNSVNNLFNNAGNILKNNTILNTIGSILNGGSNNPLNNILNQTNNVLNNLNNIGNAIKNDTNTVINTIGNLLNGGSNSTLNNIGNILKNDTNIVMGALNQTSNILNTIQSVLNNGLSNNLLNTIGSLVNSNLNGTLGNLLNTNNIPVLQQNLQAMISNFLSSKLPQIPDAQNIVNALKIFQSLVTNLPKLKQSLTGINSINNATQIISNFVQTYVDPSLNIQAVLTQYYQVVAPWVYEDIKYSKSVEDLIKNLMVYFGGNITATDPNFYFNLFSMIISSGVLDYNSLINPPTNIPTNMPYVTVPNFDFGMLIPTSSLGPLLNDTLLINHIRSYVPSLVIMLLNASTPNDVIQIVENTILVHITPAIINTTISDIQQINPALYQQIKNITDAKTLLSYIIIYLESVVINQVQLYASVLNIYLGGLTGTTTARPNGGTTAQNAINLLQTAIGNLILATYSDYMTFPNKTNADKLTTFQNNFVLFFSNPVVLNELKLYLLTVSPSAYLAVTFSIDANSFITNLKPYYPLVGSLLYSGAIQIPGLVVPNNLFGFLGYIASTTVSTNQPTQTATTQMVTLPAFYNTALANAFNQLLTTLPSATTINAQVAALNAALLANFNTTQMVSLIISKMQTINPSVYNQIMGFTTINQLLPYIQPYLSQLFLNDITTFAKNNNYPLTFISNLQNLFSVIAANASSTQPASTVSTTVASTVASTVTTPTTNPTSTQSNAITTSSTILTAITTVTLPAYYNIAIGKVFNQLFTTLPSATTTAAQVAAVNAAIIDNMNTPQLVSLIINKMQAINSTVYNQISGFTNITQIYPYIQPYLSQLFLADLTVYININGYPSTLITTIQNLFSAIAAAAVPITQATTTPTTTVTVTTTKGTTASTTTQTTTTNLLQNIIDQINRITTTGGTTVSRISLKPFTG